MRPVRRVADSPDLSRGAGFLLCASRIATDRRQGLRCQNFASTMVFNQEMRIIQNNKSQTNVFFESILLRYQICGTRKLLYLVCTLSPPDPSPRYTDIECATRSSPIPQQPCIILLSCKLLRDQTHIRVRSSPIQGIRCHKVRAVVEMRYFSRLNVEKRAARPLNLTNSTRQQTRSPIAHYSFHSSLPNFTISACSRAQYFDGAFPSSAIRAAATAALPMTV